MKFALMLNNTFNRGGKPLRFKAENGQLIQLSGNTEIYSGVGTRSRDFGGPPLLVLASGDTLSLEDLWNVLRPNQVWKGLDPDQVESAVRILEELWQESARLDFNLLQETMPILPDRDPVRQLIEAATQGRILKEAEEVETSRINASNRERNPNSESVFSRQEALRALQPTGFISRGMESFSYRPQQVAMADEVCSALENDEFLLAEAGTGVGKTMAYLVPAIYWAVATGQKVVVSTRTKALQRQLAEKDLPLLTASLPVDFAWRVAYGRDNYLCLARWHNLKLNPAELTTEEKRLLVGLAIWLHRGGQGELQELRWNDGGKNIWKHVNCQRHGCGGNMCPWQGRCYYFTARRNLNQADIIVVNHSLLLSDLAVGGHILPDYKHLIIDEAHNLDRTAFEKLSISFGVEEGLRLLARLSEKRGGVERGYLASLKARHPRLAHELAEASNQVEITRQFMRGLAGHRLADNSRWSGTCRIKPEMEGVEELSLVCREIAGALRDVSRSLEGLAELLSDAGEDLTLAGLMGEVRDANNSLWLIADSLDQGSEDEVTWMEVDAGGISFVAAGPLDVGSELGVLLYPNLKSLIMVSATLTVGGRFDYVKDRLGLNSIDPDRLREWVAPSPYDYESNCRTLAVKNLTEPGDLGYADAVARCVQAVAQTSRRRTLVLFTSKSLLLQTVWRLKEEPDLGNRLICQYLDGEFSTLISKLEATPDGILLGAETFWEGVDLPGDMLNCLVVTRLPFRPPSEPWAEAWIERLARQGRNPFVEYSLAEAVIRFRQGIGRLIRSETDSGVLVILDRRFCLPPAGRGYSGLFRASLPLQTITEINHDDLRHEIAAWFMEAR